MVGLREHSTTISMPALVVSGAVRWPIGVSSRTLRSASGNSAGVLVTMSRLVAFGGERNNELASSQLPTRDRYCSASLCRVSRNADDDPRGTISTIGCILYSVP